jgi:hypothetical protein
MARDGSLVGVGRVPGDVSGNAHFCDSQDGRRPVGCSRGTDCWVRPLLGCQAHAEPHRHPAGWNSMPVRGGGLGRALSGRVALANIPSVLANRAHMPGRRGRHRPRKDSWGAP